MLLPEIAAYLGELTNTFQRLKSAEIPSAALEKTTREIAHNLEEFVVALDELRVANAEQGGDAVHDKAHHVLSRVIPAMNAVRDAADVLERHIADKHWPLPGYREMLFVK